MNGLPKLWNRVTEKYSHDVVQIDTFGSEIVTYYSGPERADHNPDH